MAYASLLADISLALDTSERKANQELADFVMQWFAELAARRTVWDPLFQEVRELVRPNAEDFTRRVSPAMSRRQRIYDDYPTLALDNLGAGVQSNLTNSTSRWFGLSSGDAALDQRPEVALWLQKNSDIIFNEIYHPDAAFNPSSNELYLDWAGFGTGVINFLESDERVHFRSIPLAECYISENDRGLVDVLFRKFPLSKRAAMMRFPGELPDDVTRGDTKEDSIDFIHAVYPIESKIPFKSVYVHLESGTVVEEGMFREFPYCVVRWKKMSGDVYGRGPGTDCLQSVRVLNKAVQLTMEASALAAAPPVVSEDDGVLSTVVIKPYGNLRIRPGSQFPKALELTGQMSITNDFINGLRSAIGKKFYNDAFETKDYGNRERVTGTEVQEDAGSRLRKLAPVVGRMEIEFLGPLIKRVANSLMRRGKLTPLPMALKGRALRVEYLSVASKALRAVPAQNTLKFMETIIPFLQYDPEILDSINKDSVVRSVGLAMDIDQSSVISDQQVAAIRKARSDQANQQQQAQQAMNATQGIKNVAQARQADPSLGGLLQS